MTMANVMVYSADASLLNSRTSLLEHVGYRVFKATTHQQADFIVSAAELDLGVLCHTVQYEHRTALIRAAHTLRPSLPFLWLNKIPDSVSPAGVETCCSTNGPSCFLQCVNRVLAGGRAA
jgi:hypothetical protein